MDDVVDVVLTEFVLLVVDVEDSKNRWAYIVEVLLENKILPINIYIYSPIIIPIKKEINIYILSK